ncbi:unnamed protein product [Camellia sinensis]
MYNGEKIVPIKLDLRVNHMLIKDQFLWDLNNFESDPEEFARTFCRDLGIEDPEVGPAIAVAIREQLYEIAIQSVASTRETRINKKGRRGAEQFPASKAGGTAVDLMKLFGNKSSAIQNRREWDVYEPIVDILSNEEIRRICVLYGLPNETWEVNLLVEECLLSFLSRDSCERRWKRLFQLINDLPTIFEVVTGNVRQPKDQSGPHSNSSKIKSSGKMQQPRQSESQPKTVKTSPLPKLEDESGGDEE